MDADSIPLLMAWMCTNDSQGNGAEQFSESIICHIRIHPYIAHPNVTIGIPSEFSHFSY